MLIIETLISTYWNFRLNPRRGGLQELLDGCHFPRCEVKARTTDLAIGKLEERRARDHYSRPVLSSGVSGYIFDGDARATPGPAGAVKQRQRLLPSRHHLDAEPWAFIVGGEIARHFADVLVPGEGDRPELVAFGPRDVKSVRLVERYERVDALLRLVERVHTLEPRAHDVVLAVWGLQE